MSFSRRWFLQVGMPGLVLTACGGEESHVPTLGEVLEEHLGWMLWPYRGWEINGLIALPPGAEPTAMDPGQRVYPVVFQNSLLVKEKNPWLMPVAGRIRVETGYPYQPEQNPAHARWQARARALGRG